MAVPYIPVNELYSFQCIEMAVFDSSTFSGGSAYNIMNGPAQYQYYTGIGFQFDIKILEFYNGSTVGVVMSFEQITAIVATVPTLVNVRNSYLPPGGTKIIDLQTNHSDNASNGAGTLNGRKGQVIWGNSAAGTGNIYITGYR